VTGSNVEITRLELESWPITAHFHDVVLHHREDREGPPMLHVDTITVRLSIRSLVRRQLTLDDVLVDHPVVHLVEARERNVPQLSKSSASQHKPALSLGVGHLLLRNGEVSYEDTETPLDAELYGVAVDLRFDDQAGNYRGSISYQGARLQYLKYAPVRHSLTAKISFTPVHLSVESLRMTAGSSTLSLRAKIDDFTNPIVNGDYDARISAEDLGNELRPLMLAGDISFSGKLHYDNARKGPALLNLSLDGQVSGEAMSVSFRQTPMRIHSLHARYQLANGIFQARTAAMGLLGGQATVDVDIQNLDTIPSYKLAGFFKQVSLEAMQQAVLGRQLKRLALHGTVDGTAEAAWSGAISNVISHCDLHVYSAKNDEARPSSNVLPVDGVVRLSYNRQRGVISSPGTKLQVSSISLTAQGEVSRNSNLHIHVAVLDLQRLSTLISAFRPGEATLNEIAGSVELNGIMTGTMQEPRFVGQVNGDNLRIHNSRWTRATMNVRLTPWEFVLQSASVVSANQGRASMTGSIGLHHWSYLPLNPIKLNLSMERLHITDLQGMTNLQYATSGEFSGEISFYGSQFKPAGSGRMTIHHAYIFEEPLQNITLQFRAAHGAVNSVMNVAAPAGAATVNLSYVPAARSYDLRVSAPSIILEKLHTIQKRKLPISGVAKLSAEGQGSLDNPQLAAIIDVSQAEFRGNGVSQLKAQVRIAAQRLEFLLASQIAQASLQAQGYVNLAADYYCEAAIDTGILQLDHLLDTHPPNSQDSLQVQSELHATLKGPLRKTAQLEARLIISKLSATYHALQISAAEPIHVDYVHSAFNIQPAELRGSGTSIRVQGSIPVSEMSPVSLSVEGYFDATLLRMLKPDLKSSGVISLEAHSIGSVKDPAFRGQVQLRDIALSADTSPLDLEKLNGSLDIENNRVRISNLSGQVGGGELILGGSILYWPNPQFDLTFRVKSVRLRYPMGFRMLLDSDLALTGKATASTLNGRLLIDDLSFTPEFDITKLGEYFGAGTVQRQPGFGDSIKLAVAVQSPTRLSATSSLASAEGDVNLRVIGTVASPVIVGRTDLTSGEVFFRSRRYQLEHGIVVFSDPNKTTPAVDISAATKVQQYNLSLSLRGYLDKLNISYASDPPLPTADIINLIAIGRTTQEGNTASHSTDSILASQAASRFSTKMQSLTGISGLRIDPMVGGSNRDPSARIAVQQRVTKNFLFTFSTDVSQPGAETVEGKYQINKRWSIGAARDQVGGIAVNGRYHTRF
jgi:translocation and assembly module TamB